MKKFLPKDYLTLSVFMFLTLFVFSLPCRAEKREIEVKNLELYPTFECLGLRLSYSGDEDSTAAVSVRYRLKGLSQWLNAHPLSRITENRFAGSIFFLKPGAAYEVEVTITDTIGQVKEEKKIVSVTTRSDQFPVGSGRNYYVANEGNDANSGTELDRPFQTIGKAAQVAGPGDVVWVMPGLYREEIKITRSGRGNAYLAFKTLGKGVILSGTDPRYDCAGGKGKWRCEQGEVYSIDPGYKTRYVAVDRQRLYHNTSRSDFDEFICDKPGGWYQDETTGRLYIRLFSGDNPDGHMVQMAILDTGFHLENADYILIDGFEIREFGNKTPGTGIHLDKSSWCVIKNCSIHGMNSMILVSGGAKAEGNLVENCELWDTSIPGWPWPMTKSMENNPHDEEGGGVMSTGGRGTVVRGCRMNGLYDGISPSYWDSLSNESYNCDWDVYDNEISNTRDDVMEPEGPCINFRIWNNWCHDVFTGISLAPINVGPVYVLYNVLYNLSNTGLKYGMQPAEGPCYIYHNTFCYTRPATHSIVVSRPLEKQFFRNNIIFSTGWAFWTSKVPKNNNSLDFNTWYTTDTDWYEIYTGAPHKRFFHIVDKDYYFLKELQDGKGWEIHGKYTDPLFVGYQSGNLHLQGKSPCIDQGEVIPNINDHFIGKAPDMGAYESGSEFQGPFPLGHKN